MFQFNSFSGSEGKIIVPAINGVAGVCQSWTMRREDSGPYRGQYRLHAVLSYVNRVLLDADEFSKQVELVIKRDRKTGQADTVRLEFRGFRRDDNQIWAEGCTPVTKE